MLSSRWRKIFRDLLEHKSKTLLILAAMCIGIFGFSVVANSYVILEREMNENYLGITPASATIWTAPLTNDQLEMINKQPDIQAIETRERIVGRVQIGENEWKTIWLYVIEDFENLKLDTFKFELGSYPAGSGEILLERAALAVANAKVGQKLTVKIPDAPYAELDLVGTVHAPGLAPAWMEGFAYGFISQETYSQMGGVRTQTELKILLKDTSLDQSAIQTKIYELKSMLEKKGIDVSRIYVPEPGKYPHYTQMMLLLYLMEIFGLLAVILSSIIVANMINSILEQQIRQIGILKSIGASGHQIMTLYLSMVIILTFVAAVIALPIGLFLGRSYAAFAAGMLNFDIFSNKVPFAVILIEILISFIIPILVTEIPIIRSSKITVKDALSDYGINQSQIKEKTTKMTPLFSMLPKPFVVSLRNTFRKKTRLIFTLLVMAIGGTGFIVALNVYASMYNTVDVRMNSLGYDIQVNMDSSVLKEELVSTLLSVDGVIEVEPWNGVNAAVSYEDGTYGNDFYIMAPPTGTKLMDVPKMYKGQWLSTSKKREVVINQTLQALEPDSRVGDVIELRIAGQNIPWKVIGISEELFGLPTAYVNSEVLAELIGTNEYAVTAAVVTVPGQVNEVAKDIEAKFYTEGLSIKTLEKLEEYRQVIEEHLLIIAVFLIIISSLVLIVGGLGLATTTSINVMDRTKEIGIMRAIGATRKTIINIIVAEGMFIGLMSWLIAIILSYPLSQFVSYNFGMVFFEAPLRFSTSTSGMLIWLFVAIIFAGLSSFYPAYKATQLEVKNMIHTLK